MGYAQYTKCVTVDDKKLFFTPTLPAAITSVVLLLASLANPVFAIPALGAIIGYCLWWLYDRLLCLGGERCAIGLLGTVEPPSAKSFPDSLDSDYSINLLLAPHNIQELPPDYLTTPLPPAPPLTNPQEWATKKFKEALHRQIADDGIQGELIKETSTTGDRKTLIGTKRYDFEGYFSTVAGSLVKHHHQPYLHCEFEGAGMQDLMYAAMVALALATAATIACAVPAIGWLVCAVLMLAMWITLIVGTIIALNAQGKPSVFDPATGQTTGVLHPMSDILFVRGDWVYDSAHEGWNEIHPIKDCQLVAKARYEKNDVLDWDAAIASFMVARGRWRFDPPPPTAPDQNAPVLVKASGPPTPQDWRDWVKSWCDQVGAAGSGLTVTSQSRPENKWQIHPAVDGCRPAEGTWRPPH